jgi:hypothetical protein
MVAMAGDLEDDATEDAILRSGTRVVGDNE